MKAILTHDVDHLTVTEHARDLIVPKFVARATIELARRTISPSEYGRRLGGLLRNRWECLEETIAFDRAAGIPPTFFVGMANGLGLAYSQRQAAETVTRLRESGCDVGVHGIAYDDAAAIERERQVFADAAGVEPSGIRMHYLRWGLRTPALLADAGYRFDSTDVAMRPPYQVGTMWEFPVQVMDGWVLQAGRPYQANSLARAQAATDRLLEEAREAALPYLV